MTAVTETNKVGLVTGASAGLGNEYAELLAQDGYDVVLVARRRERLEALAERLGQAHGVRVYVCAEDLHLAEGPQRVYQFCRGHKLTVEVLINNAGLGKVGRFVSLPWSEHLQQIQVNLVALTALTHLFLQEMVAQGRGHILNVGSTAGFQAGPQMATYYATKAYVNSFTEALAYELKGTGVYATVHCPGPTDTEFGAVSGNGVTRLFRQRKPATAREVAADGYRAMKEGRTLKVHGVLNNLLLQSLRLSPRKTATAVAARLNQVPDSAD